MTPAALSALVLVGALVLFVSEKVRHDLVALIVLLACLALGLVRPTDALTGFADPAVIAVAAILVIGRALELSGVAGGISRILIPQRARFSVRLAMLLVVGAFLSAFMNNIAALVITMPIAAEIARHAKRPPAATLMPLAFATILGGMTTLIGTPANLILSSVREKELGEPFRRGGRPSRRATQGAAADAQDRGGRPALRARQARRSRHVRRTRAAAGDRSAGPAAAIAAQGSADRRHLPGVDRRYRRCGRAACARLLGGGSGAGRHPPDAVGRGLSLDRLERDRPARRHDPGRPELRDEWGGSDRGTMARRDPRRPPAVRSDRGLVQRVPAALDLPQQCRDRNHHGSARDRCGAPARRQPGCGVAGGADRDPADFLTPIGHQNNLLVMGPGGYRFTDYARMGGMLVILVVATAAAVLSIGYR